MKKRNFGFTLIELLVVIVIIGILATISTATFKSYFGKARDAERQSAVQNIALMMKVDGADDWKNSKYIYDISQLEFLMTSNDFRLPDSKNGICYFIGMAQRTDTGGTGDQNGFVVATWGETTSTAETGTPGLLIDGTKGAIEALETYAVDLGPLTENSFGCTANMTGPVSALDDNGFPAVSYTNTQLYINEEGEIAGSLP